MSPFYSYGFRDTLSARGLRLSDKEKAAIYGEAALRLRDAKNNLAYVESALNAIGRNLETTGKSLQKPNGFIDIDRPAFESDIASLWELKDKYASLLEECSDAQNALDKLDQQ